MASSAPATDDSPDLYALIGGDAGIRRLVERFYDVMDADPGAKDLRAMHAPDLASARDKLVAFLSGWLGGPRLYGGCVVGAHRRFPIDASVRDQWLACMDRALMEVHPALRDLLKQPFAAVADIMRNR